MSRLYSFEKHALIEKLNLPNHMITCEYGDFFVYCAICAEGKFIKSFNDEIYNNFHKSLPNDVKLGSGEFNIVIEKIVDHFYRKISLFVSNHRNCSASEKDIQYGFNCL